VGVEGQGVTSQIALGPSSDEKEVLEEGPGGRRMRGEPTCVSTTVVCICFWEGALSVLRMEKKISSSSWEAVGRLSKGDRHLRGGFRV
jgi:hypothetical protein